MKNFILLCFLSLPFIGISQGIDFEHGSWTEILAKAEKENKVIFMDAYTTWCGPCKMMARDVFTDAKVAAYFNKNFINAKINMEKGEGINLAAQYEVKAYPTLLFVDSKGEIVQKALGLHTVDQFLALGTMANDPTKSVSTWAKRYDEGEKDADFLKDYTALLWNSDDHKFIGVAQAYMETQKDWSTPENQFFIFKYADEIGTPMFDYLFKNKEKFVATFGSKIVENKIEEAFNHKMLNPDNPISLEEAENVFKDVYPAKAALLFAKFRMQYYRNRGDREGYAKAAVAYVDAFDVNDDLELNDMAWTFYEVIEDKDMLKKAVKWSKKSVKIADNYYNNDTLAALYYKLGKKCKAKKAAKKAISLAKDNNENPTATEDLLIKINAL